MLRHPLLPIAVLAFALQGCAPGKAPGTVRTSAPEGESQVRDSGIKWFENDFRAALAQAREQQGLLLVDLWADWCHTCISMKHGVLVDPALSPLAEHFSWLSIDTELPANQELIKRYPPLSWPTFFVIDPQSEAVLARFSGGATLEQFTSFLQSALHDFKTMKGEKGDGSKRQASKHLLKGNAALAAEDRRGARKAYLDALSVAPPDWHRRPDTQVLVMRSFDPKTDGVACAGQAEQFLADQQSASSSAEFFYFARNCMPSKEQPDRVKTFLLAGLYQMDRILAQTRSSASTDDQSTLLAEMRAYALAVQEPQLARGYALQQQEILDQAARGAKNAYEASGYNWPREEVYVFLGQGEKLLPELVASEQALPENYDPPYRLAWLYRQLGQLRKGEAAAKRALSLVQGPRRKRVQALLEEIETAILEEQKSSPQPQASDG